MSSTTIGVKLDEQCEIAAGWVLSKNDSNPVVSLVGHLRCLSPLLSIP